MTLFDYYAVFDKTEEWVTAKATWTRALRTALCKYMDYRVIWHINLGVLGGSVILFDPEPGFTYHTSVVTLSWRLHTLCLRPKRLGLDLDL